MKKPTSIIVQSLTLFLLVILNSCQHKIPTENKTLTISGKDVVLKQIELISIKGIYNMFWSVNRPKIIASLKLEETSKSIDATIPTKEEYPAKLKIGDIFLDIWVKPNEKITLVYNKNHKIEISDKSSVYSRILKKDNQLLSAFYIQGDFSNKAISILASNREKLITSQIRSAAFFDFFKKKILFETQILKMKKQSETNEDQDKLWKKSIADISNLNNHSFIVFSLNYLRLKDFSAAKFPHPLSGISSFSNYFNHKKEIYNAYCPKEIEETLLMTELIDFLITSYSKDCDILINKFIRESELNQGRVFFEEQYAIWRKTEPKY